MHDSQLRMCVLEKKIKIRIFIKKNVNNFLPKNGFYLEKFFFIETKKLRINIY